MCFLLARVRAGDYNGSMEWNDRFMQVFTAAVYRFHEQGRMGAEQFFLPGEQAFLASMGYMPQEMYDYVADYATLGDPTPSSILLIAAARRAFFLTNQRGIMGGAVQLKESDIPRESDEFQDIAYLPRIIRKAEAKLHGTLPRNLMFYCEKDRAFLRTHGDIAPADFLYAVWAAHGDRQKVISYVLRMMKEAAQTKGDLTINEEMKA